MSHGPVECIIVSSVGQASSQSSIMWRRGRLKYDSLILYAPYTYLKRYTRRIIIFSQSYSVCPPPRSVLTSSGMGIEWLAWTTMINDDGGTVTGGKRIIDFGEYHRLWKRWTYLSSWVSIQLILWRVLCGNRRWQRRRRRGGWICIFDGSLTDVWTSPKVIIISGRIRNIFYTWWD